MRKAWDVFKCIIGLHDWRPVYRCPKFKHCKRCGAKNWRGW